MHYVLCSFLTHRSGQSKFLGWTEDAQREFVKIRKEIKEARKKPESAELEKKILKKLRKENGIQGIAHAEEQRIKKGRKAKKIAPPEGIEGILWDNDDEWEA